MKGGRENTCKEGKTRKGNWKGETRSIYLLNVFRAFVGGGGGGLSRSHGKYEALKRESVAESSAGGNRHDSDRIPKDQRR